jgi:cell division protein FtsB
MDAALQPILGLATVLFSVLHWSAKNAIEAEKIAREKSEVRVTALETKVQVYREEQIATSQQIRSLNEKVDRVIALLERMGDKLCKATGGIFSPSAKMRAATCCQRSGGIGSGTTPATRRSYGTTTST